jgi:hypothetical protein
MNVEHKIFFSIISKTGRMKPLLFSPATFISGEEMYIPRNTIFFRCQTLCRIDGKAPELILNTKYFTQICPKQAEWNPFILPGPLLLEKECPRTQYFRGILSMIYFTQLCKKNRLNGTIPFSPVILYAR